MAPSERRIASGGLIRRDRELRFSWNGRVLSGVEGDTLASALLANGVRVVGRSFKFHRPRGILSAGVEEANALVTLGSGAHLEPNARATLVPLREGLVARAQNCWPSVDLDVGRMADALAPLLPAGFYNKTFIWPSWHLYEGLIRRAAGLGPAPRAPDPDRYETSNAHCDLLVVGAGPAGLAAAASAARAGLDVVVVEQDVSLGGTLLHERCLVDGMPGSRWAARIEAELRSSANVRVLGSTTAFGLYDHGVAGLLERCEDANRSPEPRAPRERYVRVRARNTLLATGAIEQPLLFEYNDLPGIMLAGAVRAYLNRYAVLPGTRVALATNNDSAYLTALDLLTAGVTPVAMLDSRPPGEAPLAAKLRDAGVPVYLDASVVRAHGRPELHSITVRAGRTMRIDCDLLGVSGGWQPAVHLFSHARGRLSFDSARRAFLPVAGTAPVSFAGALAGATSTSEAMEQGRAAIEALGGSSRAARPASHRVEEPRISPSVAPMPRPSGRTARIWVDFQHDVTVADVELALREGFGAIEHLKRYTTTGMSVDQGKTSNLNALVLAGTLSARTPDGVGTTTFRPPFTPVTLGAIAGRQIGERHAPRRLLPAHAEHRSLAAHFEEVGGWMRPACYPRTGEPIENAIRREVLANRRAGGLFDASPLGKIELRGADTAWFLDRFYVNNVMTLQPGRLRYGLMLDENGVVIDDGTIARLAEDHFLVTTTSGGAARISSWLEEWRQCEWPDRDVIVTPATTQWATIALSGPRAREVLAKLPTDIDLRRETFPHLQIRCGELAGVPARIYRVSFTGELTYEINVPARCGGSLWRALMEAGRDFGITPYGIESLLLMRLEKGFLHVGVDTDGTTCPADVGWGDVALRKQTDFVGRRSLTRAENLRADRLQLVGLSSEEGDALVPGAHLRLAGTHEGSDGWVTSAAVSPTLGRPIALAMLRGGRARLGEPVTIHAEEKTALATVVPMSFYDASGARMQA